MLQAIGFALLVVVPFVAIIAMLWRLSLKPGCEIPANRSWLSIAAGSGVFRHPVRAGASVLAELAGWLRRTLGKVETSLNLCVINDSVAKQREQIQTLDQLLQQVAGLGLKDSTMAAVRTKIQEKSSLADGLQASSGLFQKVLWQLQEKESEYAKLCTLAAQAAQIGLPNEAQDDIDERLRQVNEELEVQRVRFAQQVEFIAFKACRAN